MPGGRGQGGGGGGGGKVRWLEQSFSLNAYVYQCQLLLAKSRIIAQTLLKPRALSWRWHTRWQLVWRFLPFLWRWHAMVTGLNISSILAAMTHYSNWFEDFFHLRHFQIAVNFTWFIQNNLTNTSQSSRHVRQNKEKEFPVTSFVCLYYNRSWTTTNHSARNIHHIVRYIMPS